MHYPWEYKNPVIKVKIKYRVFKEAAKIRCSMGITQMQGFNNSFLSIAVQFS